MFLRKLKPEETAFLGESAEHYARLAAEHAQVPRAHHGLLAGMHRSLLVAQAHAQGVSGGSQSITLHPCLAQQETSKPLEQIAAEKGLAA